MNNELAKEKLKGILNKMYHWKTHDHIENINILLAEVTRDINKAIHLLEEPELKGLLINNRRAITIQQTVEATGVSRRTVYNWINKGEIEIVYGPTKTVRVYADSIWKSHDRRKK